MARTAIVRSASLAPTEAAMADDLAELVANGSFTELTRIMLTYFGLPLKQRLDDLRRSGIDPREHLFTTQPTPADGEEQVRDFYGPSSWPEKWPEDR